MALLEAKTIVGLVIDGRERLPSLPDVPTVAEVGFKGRPAVFCAFAPAKTSQRIVDYMRTEISKVLADPAFRKRNIADRGAGSKCRHRG